MKTNNNELPNLFERAKYNLNNKFKKHPNRRYPMDFIMPLQLYDEWTAINKIINFYAQNNS